MQTLGFPAGPLLLVKGRARGLHALTWGIGVSAPTPCVSRWGQPSLRPGGQAQPFLPSEPRERRVDRSGKLSPVCRCTGRDAFLLPAPSGAGFSLTVLSLRGSDVWLDKQSSLEHELRFLCERALFKMLPWMLKFQKTRKEKARNCPQMLSRRGSGLSRCWRTPPTCPQADSELPGGRADLAGRGRRAGGRGVPLGSLRSHV